MDGYRGRIFMRCSVLSMSLISFLLFIPSNISAAIAIPTLKIGVEQAAGSGQASMPLQILLLLTVLSLAPAILILLTSFTRIVIIFSFMRQALGTQQMPPNQIMVGLALFLTFFVMAPIFGRINKEAIKPYLADEIVEEVAFDRAIVPLKDFMLRQTREKDLGLFVNMSKLERPENRNEIPFHVVVPSFIISELRIAFQIGFMIYIPFIVIDMVVASVLMSMGMMMLPPIMISLPFKIMLFVLIDGWYLLVGSIVKGFV